MSYQAYLDAIEDRTAETPDELLAAPRRDGDDATTKAAVAGGRARH